MSVLIEALTLVVPKLVLGVVYPGGADAFLGAMLNLDRPPRFICGADPDLVNISFYDPKHLTPAAELLTIRGAIEVDASVDEFVELAYVDQRYGPTMPCPWLEWRVHQSGFTYAWLASAPEPGDMAAPLDWTAEQSRNLTRRDARDDANMFRLSSEEGIEYWLDLLTSEISAGLARPSGDDQPADLRSAENDED